MAFLRARSDTSVNFYRQDLFARFVAEQSCHQHHFAHRDGITSIKAGQDPMQRHNVAAFLRAPSTGQRFAKSV